MRIKLFDFNDLNIVEFAVGEVGKQCELCTDSSKYLHGAVFTVFQSAFILSNQEFNYFSKTDFQDSRLITLRNHLQDYLSRIISIKDAEDLEMFVMKQVEGIDFLNEMKTFYPDWRIRWERFKNELKTVLREIIDLVDECIDEEKVFWVKGY